MLEETETLPFLLSHSHLVNIIGLLDSGQPQLSNNFLFPLMFWMSHLWALWQGVKEAGQARVSGFFTAASLSLGPCFFLSCPIGIEDFRTWFIDLWNNSIIPYLQEGAKDGIKVSLTF